MKRFLKVLLIIVLVIVLAAAGLIGWLSIAEYKPEAVEEPEKKKKRKERERHEQQKMEESIIPGTGTRPDLSDDAGIRICGR